MLHFLIFGKHDNFGMHSAHGHHMANTIDLSCMVVPSVLSHCWLGVRKSIRPVKIEY